MAAPLGDTARHPLETEALQYPEAVLKQLPALIAEADRRDDDRELALLELAHANACRVVADWACQRDAGQAARIAADRANEPYLAIRALIAESRGLMAQQDYSPGSRQLAEAERRLGESPSPALMADVQLGYSSMSNFLGRHELARNYAQRGLDALGKVAEPLVRARLLRNRGRAEANLGLMDEARTSFNAAIQEAAALNDPKLSAELDLELARFARGQHDVSTQRASAARVLALAERFGNAQLRALGQEVLGWLAADQNELDQAEAAFTVAQAQFRHAGLEGDERRVLRELIRIRLQRQPDRRDLADDTRRLLELDDIVEQREYRVAGDEFEARLRYAEQEFKLQRLAKETELAAEREKALTASNRQRAQWIGFGIVSLAVALVWLGVQRRANARLSGANTQLRASETALATSQQQLRAIADNIPAIVSHFDRDERYTFSNAMMVRLFGNGGDGVVGRTIREVLGERIYAALEPHLRRAFAGESVSFEGHTEVIGQTVHYQTSYIPELDAQGRVVGCYALTFDITRLKQAEAQLAREARHDALTGVGNRRHFEERLATAMTHGRHRDGAVAVLYLDIDFLKQINDRHGHAVGDQAIRAFAQRLSACAARDDLVARIGGDEFVVLSEQPDATKAAQTAERMAHAIIAAMAAPVVTTVGELKLGASIGIAVTQAVHSADALIAGADRALYAAKAAGRNTWRRADLR